MPRPTKRFALAAVLAAAAVAPTQRGVAQQPPTPAATDAPTLAQDLQARSDEFAAQAPAELMQKFADGVEAVRRLRLVETAKNRGDAAPDGELVGPDGAKTRLSDLWADGPVVLVFYRGGWCPYCNLQLRALERSADAIAAAGARLVAVAPELPEKTAETAANNGLSFAVLSDPDNGLARAFGIVFELPEVIRPIYEERIGLAAYNGNDKSELPLAASYVIDSSGVIRWAWLDADYKRRAEPADLLGAVEGLGGSH